MYDAAKAKGDTAGMAAAHAAAETIRNTARSSNEVGSTSGYTYTVSSNGSASLNKYDSAALDKTISGGGSTLNGSSYLPEKYESAIKIMIQNYNSMMPALTIKDTNNVNPNNVSNYSTNGIYASQSTSIYVNLGDPKASEAFTKWINSNPQLRYQYDPRYNAMSVSSFQNKLLYMSSKGIDLSRYTVNDLNKLFEDEAEFQSNAFSGIPAGTIVGGATQEALSILEKIKNFFTGTSNTLKPGTLSNLEARTWYLTQESKIPSMIDKNLSLEQQAKRAVELRNQFRTQTRNLMEDRELANSLSKSDPNLSWEQVVQKYSDKGLQGDALYQEIINAAQRSRTSVNQSLGL